MKARRSISSSEQVLKAEQRYSRVQELYLDGQIDREQYEKELESYENGQKTLQPEKLCATIALLDHLRTELSRWDALSPIEKKRLLRLALEGAWVRENALVALQPTIAFLPILVRDRIKYVRREWDSNPRWGQAPQRFSRPSHSATLASLQGLRIVDCGL